MNELEVEVFRAGDYGPKGVWRTEDLDRIAAGYDAALHEAPVTLDHAQTGPALGWVAGLRRHGDRLLARLHRLNDDLLAQLREGAFRKRSVELYRAMPETGLPYLKAVSFLGAAAPAVKGLRDVLFSESAATGEASGIDPGAQPSNPEPDDEAFAAERNDKSLAADRFEFDAQPIETGDTPAADAVRFNAAAPVPDEPESRGEVRFDDDGDLGGVTASTRPLSVGPDDANAAQAQPQPETAAEDDSVNSDSRPAPAEQAAASLTPAAPSFAEVQARLRERGRWAPAWERTGIAAFFDALASANEIELASGERLCAAQWFAGFLEQLPQILPLGEAAAPHAASARSVSFGSAHPAVPFAAALNPAALASGDNVSAESIERHRRAVALCESRPGLAYAEALLHASRG